MLTIKYSFLIFINLILFTTSQNVCNLRIADSPIAVYKGMGIIYDNGVLNADKYAENSVTPYTSTQTKDIEFLYAFEIHKQTAEHIPLVNNILI